MSFKWTTALNMDELWLNSDREILGRAEKTAGKVGIVLTIELPNGEKLGVEVDKLNAETGSQYCHVVRETYSEWKASKEAASRRKQRDREQQAILDAAGASDGGGDLEAGTLSVPETVEALETSVQGATSLEEEVIHRIDAAYDARAKLRGQLESLTKKLTQCEEEIKQLEQMKEIFSASKVLEAVSGSVREQEGQEGEGGLGSEAHSPTPDGYGGESPEPDSEVDQT